VTMRIRDALLACWPLGELEQIAAEEGVGSLWDAADAKVRAGLTTEAEVLRVLGRRPGS
jgi:hypothetical protein